MATILANSDPRWAGWYRRWARPTDLGNYDTIKFNMNLLMELSVESGFASLTTSELERLLSEPALPEFAMTFPPLLDEEIVICFKKTIMPMEELVLTDGTGVNHTTFPLVDAFISCDGGDRFDWVVNLGKRTEKEAETVFVAWAAWRRGPEYGQFPEFTSELATLYTVAQYTLWNRPTVFKTVSERPISVRLQGSKKKYKHRRSKVKVVRVMELGPLEAMTKPLPPEAEPLLEMKLKPRKLTYTVDSWGVVGHPRHLKNGRIVWVKPYRKGPKRHEAGTYVAKDYEP